jgi:hypothetical protein
MPVRKALAMAGFATLLTGFAGASAVLHAQAAPVQAPLVTAPVGFAAMEDGDLADVTGEGIALSLDDFRITSSPTSRFEILGQAPSTPIGQSADARWYGISVSANNPLTTWLGSCGAGIAGMGCPIGGLVQGVAFDNPFIWRVFDYSGINFQGAPVQQSVFELLAPTNHEPLRVSNWSELLIGKNPNNKLQGQLIFANSRLFHTVNGVQQNNKFRIVSHTDDNDPTIGFIWENRYQGDFRYSVNQTFASIDQVGAPPSFGNVEGIYALGLNVYFPAGHMFYQSLILDSTPAKDGNFRIELTRPGVVSSTVRNDFYSLASDDVLGYKRTGRPARYFETHGFFRIGNWTPPDTCANNPANAPNCLPRMMGVKPGVSSTDTGIFFVAWSDTDVSARFQPYSARPVPPVGNTLANADATSNIIPTVGNSNCGGNANCGTGSNTAYNIVNIGTGRIEGLLINHMEITTRGVN